VSSAAAQSRVGLFVTCIVDLMRPEIGFSVLRLLERAGFQVCVPDQQTCCGQPGFNAGDTSAARSLALKFLDEFESFDYVVVPSGSCGGMIKVHFAELFAAEPATRARAEDLAARVFELADFLANVANVSSVPSDFMGRITYHDCCSGLRELGVAAQPRLLLSLVPGVTLCEMEQSRACCGFGGAFAAKFGDISTAIADEKILNISKSGADSVVMGDLGCMLHIEGRLRRRGDTRTRVLHLAQVLDGSNALGTNARGMAVVASGGDTPTAAEG